MEKLFIMAHKKYKLIRPKKKISKEQAYYDYLEQQSNSRKLKRKEPKQCQEK